MPGNCFLWRITFNFPLDILLFLASKRRASERLSLWGLRGFRRLFWVGELEALHQVSGELDASFFAEEMGKIQLKHVENE
jgi:hypothetical protein